MSERAAWSVVVASFRELDLLTACLNSLRPQCTRLGVELVLARSAPGPEELPSQVTAGCRMVRVPTRASLPAIRGAGLAQASGEWVAITEDHCVAEPHWLEALIRAAGSGNQVLGGSMGNARRQRATDCGAFLAEYGFYGAVRTRAVGRRPPDVTQANAAYHHSIVASVAQWAQDGNWEDVIHGRLHAAGCAFQLVPSAQIQQNQSYGLGAHALERFDHGRTYGALRRERLSRWQRVVHLVGTPALPVVLASRIMRSLSPGERRYALRGLPAMLVFLLAWSVGEAVGYARGAPR